MSDLFCIVATTETLWVVYVRCERPARRLRQQESFSIEYTALLRLPVAVRVLILASHRACAACGNWRWFRLVSVVVSMPYVRLCYQFDGTSSTPSCDLTAIPSIYEAARS